MYISCSLLFSSLFPPSLLYPSLHPPCLHPLSLSHPPLSLSPSSNLAVRWILVVFTMVGFIILDMAYTAVVVNYSIQCQLLIYLMQNICDRMRTKEWEIEQAIKVRGHCGGGGAWEGGKEEGGGEREREGGREGGREGEREREREREREHCSNL